MFQRCTQILVAGTAAEFGAIKLWCLFVHVGHNLWWKIEAIDDLIFPLVDQHTILEKEQKTLKKKKIGFIEKAMNMLIFLSYVA